MRRSIGRSAGARAVLAASGALLLAAVVVPAGSAQTQPPPPLPGSSQATSDQRLGEDDRRRLEEAEAAGRSRVSLLIAADDDRVVAAADQARALGGRIEALDRRVDYLKVSVPTDSAERVAKLPAVFAVDVDGLVPREDPRPTGTTNPIPQAAPGPGTPRVNPYLPIGDTGAAQFATADGRGTTVAILDSGIDLDHPALRTTTGGGPKVVDWYTANAPDSGDGTWVTTAGRHTGAFTADERSWTAPATGGPYAFGVFDEDARDLGVGEFGGDVDRDGTRAERIGVLQDRVTKHVRVDVDQDRDFTDETPMADFKVARDVGHLGTDRPETAVADRVPFVVVTDRSDYEADADTGSVVALGISGYHGSHVAGIVAGNGLFGGPMTGAAPGAELMAVKVCLTTASCTSSGLIDGLLYAARAGADVANLSVGGLPALNDANNARAELYDRTIDEFDMQLFVSAGNNGPGANTVGDPSVATRTVSVGGSVTRETWLSNYGVEVSTGLGFLPFSSHGPREDGGLKPTVIAPGAAVSTTPLWQAGSPVQGTYELPPGYAMMAGTSMAAPQGTGAAALLVSAYKVAHGGQRPTAAALRTAITTGAAFQEGLGAYGQGAGLVDVGAAWEVLRSQAPPAHRISSSVPVSTVLSPRLREPGVGTGIHEREGLDVGDELTRTYTLRRTSGPDEPRVHHLRWRGDDGTFSTTAEVVLPLGEPVALDVRVTPRSPGIHSAVLEIDDPATAGVDHHTQNVAFAPHALEGGAATLSGTVPRAGAARLLVRVPEGAGALRVDLEGGGSGAGQGQLRFLRYRPVGLSVDSNGSAYCFVPNAGSGCPTGSPVTQTLVAPEPGVWEIVVENRHSASADPASFEATATVLGARVAPDPDHVVGASLGTAITRSYTVTNEHGAFTGRLEGGGPLGSTQRRRPTVDDGQTQTFDVTLPAGVTTYTVDIEGAEDGSSDLDLVVKRCTTPQTCVVVAQSAGAAATERVTVNAPQAGTYRIEVLGYAVPAGSTVYDLVDAWRSPTLGAITSDDTAALRPPGASWSPTATLTPLASPGEGRTLTGAVRVLIDDGTEVGRADVTFTLDQTAPETRIDEAPGALTNESAARLAFSADEPATFRCALDDGEASDCSSPQVLTDLEDGEHVFTVTATDRAGNADPTPATARFTVDTRPPETEITDGPGPTTPDGTPTFTFTGDELGSTFECQVDTGPWETCEAPFTTPELADGEAGSHTFRARAIDAAGNVDPSPAQRAFGVTAPSRIVAEPATARIGGLLTLRLSPAARLTTRRTGLAIVGRRVTFATGSSPICSALTDATGTARCGGLLPLLGTLLGSGYDATFAGDAQYAPAVARGALVTLGGAFGLR